MNNSLITKLYEEHRTAWYEIASIKNSTETAEEKANRIIKLFNTELIPHFKQEEDELFTDDAESKMLIAEHKTIYALVDAIASQKKESDINDFFTIMDIHIKKEDAYFNKLNNTSSGALPVILIIAVVVIILMVMCMTCNG